MPLPAFPTEAEIDTAYPVLPNPGNCEVVAALQHAECLNRAIELLRRHPLTALERDLVHRVSDQEPRTAPVERAGVRR